MQGTNVTYVKSGNVINVLIMTSKKKRIRGALKIKGIYWNCKSCDEYIKEINKECIHCNSENKASYIYCNYCNAWKCEDCLKEKENLNKEQCKEIIAEIEDRIGHMLSWACGICREKKKTKKKGWMMRMYS